MRTLGPAALLLLSSCAGPWQAGDERFLAGDFVGAHEAYGAAKLGSPVPPDPQLGLRIEKARIEAARQLHRRAMEQADGGDLDGAVEILQRARRIDPANRDIEDALEMAAARGGDAGPPGGRK